MINIPSRAQSVEILRWYVLFLRIFRVYLISRFLLQIRDKTSLYQVKEKKGRFLKMRIWQLLKSK